MKFSTGDGHLSLTALLERSEGEDNVRCRVRILPLPDRLTIMPIFGALGLGVAIVVLKVLTPEIFSALENVVLTFLRGAQVALNAASQLAAVAGQFSAH